jgi:hypothetical protein
MHLCISTEILNAREKERKCSGQTTYLLEVSQEGRGQRHVDNLSNDAQSSPGKIEYRAAPGQGGNWYQQDAYACGLILRDLQGSADILETVANGLLAPPEERLSVSDAAAILTGEL